MKKKSVTCIIQARVSSTRLPGKVLLYGYNKPLLLHLIERLKKAKFIKKIIIATTINKEDDLIVDLCKKNKIKFFRGSPSNLLDRYYKCSRKFNAKDILRITSDCPLMDYELVDKIIKKYFILKSDFISNVHPPTFPDGFDVEIFNFKTLRKTFLKAKKDYEKEHVTPYMWDNNKEFKVDNYVNEKGNFYSKFRLTLDYNEDYFVISKIFNSLYKKNKYFKIEEIINFLKKNRQILINQKLIKVNWYRHHINELKTIKKIDTKKYN
ncbi:MAG: hypothetical protein CBC25_00720 [Pelagibacteraceae bacterium TMED65]|nr:MAG: hypothetical protein CBC25_00720 [Pelagibacteraceae bacterium TMED65]|tara:strand:+ start:462 stop:1259 length:798 start_codon:yes stop_codon:yes gene_type:complete